MKIASAIAAATLLAASAASFAQTTTTPAPAPTAGAPAAASNWDKNHPRRAEVNARLANQNKRIDAEKASGQITGAQAKALHQDDHAIRSEEKSMASMDHGHITKADQKALNQQENHVSSAIGK